MSLRTVNSSITKSPLEDTNKVYLVQRIIVKIRFEMLQNLVEPLGSRWKEVELMAGHVAVRGAIVFRTGPCCYLHCLVHLQFH